MMALYALTLLFVAGALANQQVTDSVKKHSSIVPLVVLGDVIRLNEKQTIRYISDASQKTIKKDKITFDHDMRGNLELLATALKENVAENTVLFPNMITKVRQRRVPQGPDIPKIPEGMPIPSGLIQSEERPLRYRRSPQIPGMPDPSSIPQSFGGGAPPLPEGIPNPQEAMASGGMPPPPVGMPIPSGLIQSEGRPLRYRRSPQIPSMPDPPTTPQLPGGGAPPIPGDMPQPQEAMASGGIPQSPEELPKPSEGTASEMASKAGEAIKPSPGIPSAPGGLPKPPVPV